MANVATDVQAIKDFFQVQEIKKKVEGETTFYKVTLPKKRLVPFTEVIFKDEEYSKTVDDLMVQTLNNLCKRYPKMDLLLSSDGHRIKKGDKIILKYFKMSKYHYIVMNGSSFEIDTYPKLLVALEFLANFY